MNTVIDRFRSLGLGYNRIRHEHRYGRALRYVTIIAGTLVTALGVIAIPYPGPGWAIVFFGLLILSQELEWADRLRARIMRILSGFYSHYVDGNRVAQATLAVATGAIVMATLWLTGALGLAQGWVDLDFRALNSPLA
ncbi:TIGR02611 family protein [Gordonia sp. (in: high G+C Gram-positive bacteria)]|uniref:TIGR02611 family protein n=1 Tax=Gordonia sp. (in: high G+C Gram-positive bacteria) TaxID=84139 RepID=UPI003340D656